MKKKQRSVTDMELMLDTANLEELKAGLDFYPVDGVTTNPSILKADLPFEYYKHLKAIKKLCGKRTFHVQLGSETCEDMIIEAKEVWSKLGQDVYLKIPVTREGIKAIKVIKHLGGFVTATCIYHTVQGIMAIHAGADYLAPYCNRMSDKDIDFVEVISQLRELIDRDGYNAKILAASFKNMSQVTQAIYAGAHTVTVQPALLNSALQSPLVTAAADVFTKDYNRVREGK